MQTTAHAVNADEILANVPQIGGIVPMYLGGEWRLAAGGATREIHNPANGRAVARVAEGGAADAEAAIAAARRAFDEGPWGSMSIATSSCASTR
jgi:Aldehyde dehydrogenase family